MDLRITQSYARIGIISHPARMTLKQPKPVLSIESPAAEMDIDTQLPKVHIDQSRCFAESGLKSPFELTREMALDGMEAALLGIGRIAREGDRMMAIENGENVIADIAWQSLFSEGELTTVTMPVSRPEITVSGGVQIHFKPRPPRIQWETHSRAVVEATFPRVEFYLLQKPGIQIEYVGKNFDRRI